MNVLPPVAQYPAVSRLEDFDSQSGSLLERLLFNHRPVLLCCCLLITVILAAQIPKLTLNASFEKMIPAGHPYIQNYLQYRKDLVNPGNAIRVIVEARRGTIFDAAYLDTLRRISDEVFLQPGVDRPRMKSLWTPATRWIAVTEEGLEGGPVIGDGYDGSERSLDEVRINVERSGEIGQLVAANHGSSIVFAPLLEQPIDYRSLAGALERIRAKYESETIRIHITGFAKIAGDLIEGLEAVLLFFAIAIVIVSAMLYASTRCLRSTALVIGCSLVAVVWLLGLLPLLGHVLDPYSILVPFLIFAIGVSHGVQKMNGIRQDTARGTHRLIAARYTFRRLFLAGLTALLGDAVGFAALALIPIQIIRELAVVATIGVAALIFTNLALLPVLLSYAGVKPAVQRKKIDIRFLRRWTGHFHDGRWALSVVVCAAAMGIAGFGISRNLKIGDLDAGAPELRPDSRYNLDNAFLIANYGASSDTLIVMVKTPTYRCAAYRTLVRMDTLEWELQQLPEVAATRSLAGLTKELAAGMNEGSLKWYAIPRTQQMLNAIAGRAPEGYSCRSGRSRRRSGRMSA